MKCLITGASSGIGKEMADYLASLGYDLFLVATDSKKLKELFKDVAKELKELPKEEIVETDEKIIYTLKEEKQGFEVKKVNGEFIVSGPDVDKLMARVNLSDNESMSNSV